MLRRKVAQFMTEEFTSQKSLFSKLTSVRFPDLNRSGMLQSLPYLLCDLLLHIMHSAVIPGFRKFFIGEM